MGAWERANEAALLAAGNTPEWVVQSGHTGPPTSPGDGVHLWGALRTLVHVSLRRDLTRRVARGTVSGSHTSGFVRAIVGGVTLSTSANQTPEQIVSALVSEINGSVTAGAIVSASVGDSPNEIVLVGKTSADWSFSLMSTVPQVTTTAEADAVASNAILWGLMGGTGDVPGEWVALRGWEALGISSRGFAERFDTGGIDRLYVELRHVSGHPSDGAEVVPLATVRIGPSVLP